jgi:hypothetical protein
MICSELWVNKVTNITEQVLVTHNPYWWHTIPIGDTQSLLVTHNPIHLTTDTLPFKAYQRKVSGNSCSAYGYQDSKPHWQTYLQTPSLSSVSSSIFSVGLHFLVAFVAIESRICPSQSKLQMRILKGQNMNALWSSLDKNKTGKPCI